MKNRAFNRLFYHVVNHQNNLRRFISNKGIKGIINDVEIEESFLIFEKALNDLRAQLENRRTNVANNRLEVYKIVNPNSSRGFCYKVRFDGPFTREMTDLENKMKNYLALRNRIRPKLEAVSVDQL